MKIKIEATLDIPDEEIQEWGKRVVQEALFQVTKVSGK